MDSNIRRTLFVRLSYSHAGEMYAHATGKHFAERGDDDSPDFGRLYRHEHPAANFALSAQAGGLAMPNGSPRWYAWRIGFDADTGAACSIVDATDALENLRACAPIARKVSATLADFPGAMDTNPAAVMIAAARALKVHSITLAAPDQPMQRLRMAKPGEWGAAAPMLVRAFSGIETRIAPTLRAA